MTMLWFGDGLPRCGGDLRDLHGHPSDIRDCGDEMRDLAHDLARTRVAVQDVEDIADGTSWGGQAFEAYRDKVDKNPKGSDIENLQQVWLDTADVFDWLADKLSDCQDTVGWCRDRIDGLGLPDGELTDDQRAQVESIVADVDDAHAEWEGYLGDAHGKFADLAATTIYADPPPGFWEQAGDVAMDTLYVAGQIVVGVFEGIWELVKGIAVGVWTFLTTPFSEWDDAFRDFKESMTMLWQAFEQDPWGTLKEVGKALVDWDLLMENPGRWIGHLLPHIALAIFTGGVGLAVSVSLRVVTFLAQICRLPRVVNRLQNATSAVAAANSVVSIWQNNPWGRGAAAAITDIRSTVRTSVTGAISTSAAAVSTVLANSLTEFTQYTDNLIAATTGGDGSGSSTTDLDGDIDGSGTGTTDFDGSGTNFDDSVEVPDDTSDIDDSEMVPDTVDEMFPDDSTESTSENAVEYATVGGEDSQSSDPSGNGGDSTDTAIDEPAGGTDPVDTPDNTTSDPATVADTSTDNSAATVAVDNDASETAATADTTADTTADLTTDAAVASADDVGAATSEATADVDPAIPNGETLGDSTGDGADDLAAWEEEFSPAYDSPHAQETLAHMEDDLATGGTGSSADVDSDGSLTEPVGNGATDNAEPEVVHEPAGADLVEAADNGADVDVESDLAGAAAFAIPAPMAFMPGGAVSPTGLTPPRTSTAHSGNGNTQGDGDGDSDAADSVEPVHVTESDTDAPPPDVGGNKPPVTPPPTNIGGNDWDDDSSGDDDEEDEVRIDATSEDEDFSYFDDAERFELDAQDNTDTAGDGVDAEDDGSGWSDAYNTEGDETFTGHLDPNPNDGLAAIWDADAAQDADSTANPLPPGYENHPTLDDTATGGTTNDTVIPGTEDADLDFSPAPDSTDQADTDTGGSTSDDGTTDDTIGTALEDDVDDVDGYVAFQTNEFDDFDAWEEKMIDAEHQVLVDFGELDSIDEAEVDAVDETVEEGDLEFTDEERELADPTNIGEHGDEGSTSTDDPLWNSPKFDELNRLLHADLEASRSGDFIDNEEGNFYDLDADGDENGDDESVENDGQDLDDEAADTGTTDEAAVTSSDDDGGNDENQEPTDNYRGGEGPLNRYLSNFSDHGTGENSSSLLGQNHRDNQDWESFVDSAEHQLEPTLPDDPDSPPAGANGGDGTDNHDGDPLPASDGGGSGDHYWNMFPDPEGRGDNSAEALDALTGDNPTWPDHLAEWDGETEPRLGDNPDDRPPDPPPTTVDEQGTANSTSTVDPRWSASELEALDKLWHTINDDTYPDDASVVQSLEFEPDPPAIESLDEDVDDPVLDPLLNGLAPDDPDDRMPESLDDWATHLSLTNHDMEGAADGVRPHPEGLPPDDGATGTPTRPVTPNDQTDDSSGAATPEDTDGDGESGTTDQRNNTEADGDNGDDSAEPPNQDPPSAPGDGDPDGIDGSDSDDEESAPFATAEDWANLDPGPDWDLTTLHNADGSVVPDELPSGSAAEVEDVDGDSLDVDEEAEFHQWQESFTDGSSTDGSDDGRHNPPPQDWTAELTESDSSTTTEPQDADTPPPALADGDTETDSDSSCVEPDLQLNTGEHESPVDAPSTGNGPNHADDDTDVGDEDDDLDTGGQEDLVTDGDHNRSLFSGHWDNSDPDLYDGDNSDTSGNDDDYVDHDDEDWGLFSGEDDELYSGDDIFTGDEDIHVGLSAEERAFQEAARAAIVAVPEGHTFGPGCEVKITTVTFGDRQAEFTGDIIHDGVVVGRMDRRLYYEGGQLHVDHKWLEIDSDLRGQGFATDLNRHFADWYREIGVVDIHIHASGRGAYVWALKGFNWTRENEACLILDRLDEMLGSGHGTTAERAAALDILERSAQHPFGHEDYPTVGEIANLGYAGPDGNLGRDVLQGMTWHGAKPVGGPDGNADGHDGSDDAAPGPVGGATPDDADVPATTAGGDSPVKPPNDSSTATGSDEPDPDGDGNDGDHTDKPKPRRYLPLLPPDTELVEPRHRQALPPLNTLDPEWRRDGGPNGENHDYDAPDVDPDAPRRTTWDEEQELFKHEAEVDPHPRQPYFEENLAGLDSQMDPDLPESPDAPGSSGFYDVDNVDGEIYRIDPDDGAGPIERAPTTADAGVNRGDSSPPDDTIGTPLNDIVLPDVDGSDMRIQEMRDKDGNIIGWTTPEADGGYSETTFDGLERRWEHDNDPDDPPDGDGGAAVDNPGDGGPDNTDDTSGGTTPEPDSETESDQPGATDQGGRAEADGDDDGSDTTGPAYGSATWSEAQGQLTKAQADALQDYAGPARLAIDGYLRSREPMPDDIAEAMRHLDEALNIQPTPETIKGVTVLSSRDAETLLDPYDPGSQQVPGYLSVTLHQSQLDELPRYGIVLADVEVPPGVPAMFMDGISRLPTGRLVLQRGLTLQRTGDAYVAYDARVHVPVKVMPPDTGTSPALPPPGARPSVGDLVSERHFVYPEQHDVETSVQGSLAEMLEGRTFGPGCQVEMVKVSAFHNRTFFEAKIVVDGTKVGEIKQTLTREKGKLHVKYELLKIEEPFRGHGFATDFNRYLENWYRESGVVSVRLYAALTNGGYTWARAGFNWYQEQEAYDILLSLRDELDSADLTAGERAAVQDIVNRSRLPFRHDDFPTVGEIAEIGYTEHPGEHFGRTFLSGRKWHGEKYL